MIARKLLDFGLDGKVEKTGFCCQSRTKAALAVAKKSHSLARIEGRQKKATAFPSDLFVSGSWAMMLLSVRKGLPPSVNCSRK